MPAARRLERGLAEIGRPREGLDRSVEGADFQLRSLADPAQDRPCFRQRLIDRPGAALEAHAGRTVEQHHDQAVSRGRLGREHVRPGEQEGDQGQARHPQREQEPAPQLPPPRVVAQHDLEELERPQVDRAGPLAEHQVDDDRDRQGAERAEHSELNELHGASEGI